METMEERIQFLKETDEMDYTEYYCGYKLLEKKDLDGRMPEIIICSGNRTAGKTFFWKRLMVRYCLKYKRRFLMICRKRTQVNGAANSFIEDLQQDELFKGIELEVTKSDIQGIISLNASGIIIGLFTYYNFADSIKEMSNLFNKVDIIFKDEFQSTADYVEDEVGKLRSIHKSVARGFGKHTRFVLTILSSNQISIINPYFIAFGIHRRLKTGTKFLRGTGWVMENHYNPYAAKRAKESRFEKAFGDDSQALSDNCNQFMDSVEFVSKVSLKGMKQEFTFYNKGKGYGLWCNGKFFYVSRKYDPNHRRRFCTTLEDHAEGVTLLRRGDLLLGGMKKYFEAGKIRFEDVECRVAMIEFFGMISFW